MRGHCESDQLNHLWTRSNMVQVWLGSGPNNKGYVKRRILVGVKRLTLVCHPHGSLIMTDWSWWNSLTLLLQTLGALQTPRSHNLNSDNISTFLGPNPARFRSGINALLQICFWNWASHFPLMRWRRNLKSVISHPLSSKNVSELWPSAFLRCMFLLLIGHCLMCYNKIYLSVRHETLRLLLIPSPSRVYLMESRP